MYEGLLATPVFLGNELAAEIEMALFALLWVACRHFSRNTPGQEWVILIRCPPLTGAFCPYVLRFPFSGQF